MQVNFLKGLNSSIVLPIFLIFSFGFLAIFANEPRLAAQQLLFFFVGLMFFFAIAAVDVRVFKDLALLFWAITLVTVLGVTFFAPEIRGSSRWIELGFFRFQPTELGKPVVILALASILESQAINPTKTFFKSLGLVAPFVIFAFLQPDLGNAIIFLLIWFAGLYICGFNWKVLGGVVLFFLAILPVFLSGLAPYQKLRLETFLSPEGDPLGAGYSTLQSQIAVGAGRFFGQGLQGATQSRLEFLPEAPTDFIFASISESLGFVGAAVLVGLFGILIYQLVVKAANLDRFSQILVLQVASLLFVQFFINLAMSVGLLPVVGVTLPFVSYGGSSLASSFILLALVQSRLKFSPKA